MREEIEAILEALDVPKLCCAYCPGDLFPPVKCYECNQYVCDKYACNDKHDLACHGSMVWGA